MSGNASVPSTPKVISPSPTPGDQADEGSYFPPTTRSAAKRASQGRNGGASSSSNNNNNNNNSIADTTNDDPDARSRTLSRSPTRAGASTARRRKSGVAALSTGSSSSSSGVVKKSEPIKTNNHAPNGHLSPTSALSPGSSIKRGGGSGAGGAPGTVSRSPSPLGLIPLHTQWRSFIHRHEVPRKALHVSIGFLTLRLYTLGVQPAAIHPVLMGALLPIAAVDLARHRWPAMNRLYVRVCGALMRESEVNERYNGVVWYLLGAWAAMRFMPKDVGAVSILLLSWCDTAASTVGRRYGRYTPSIRPGKSLAGSAAACVTGVATALLWWGWVVPAHYGFEDSFQFKGYLTASRVLGLLSGGGGGSVTGAGVQDAPRITGWVALGVMSLWSGFVASVSEAVDLFSWDDNLTIPILSGIGLWSFLKVFG